MSIDLDAQQRRAELRAELADHSMYELVGGEDGIRRLVDRFYEIMDTDPQFAPIRRMHKTDLAPMRLSLFEYLSGWLGGPQLYIERHGSPCLTGAHAPYKIDEQARDLWVACMDQAMHDTGLALKYREALTPAFEGMGDMMRNDDCGPGSCDHG